MARLKLPNGQYLRIPDNATQEQVDSAIASLPEEMRTPKAAPAETREQRLARLTAQAESERIDPTEGMTTFEKAAAGAGSSAAATIRQARRLGNLGVKNIPGVSHLARYMGFNPEENLEKLDQETEEARQLEAPLMATTAGKLGRVGGDIAQAVALTAATGGLGAGAGGATGLRALGQVALRDAAAGGIQGALQDTGKGESIGKNILTNAALGAALPVGGAALKKGKQIADEVGISSALRLGTEAVGALPIVGAPARGLLNVAERRETNRLMAHANALREHSLQTAPLRAAHTEAKREAVAVAKEQTKQANKAAGEAYKAQVGKLNAEAKATAGKALEDITSGFHVKITPAVALKARNLKAKYAGLLKDKPDLARALDQMTINGAKMPGKNAASLKSSVGEAARATREGKQGLHEIERFVTDSMMDNLPKAKADALREAFESYGRGARSELLPPKPVNITVKPNVPELALPPVPVKPGTGPYTRSRVQAARTATLRGAALRQDRKEK